MSTPKNQKLLSLLAARDPRFLPLIGTIEGLVFAAIHGAVITHPQSQRILALPEPELDALSNAALFQEIDGLIGAELSPSSKLPQDMQMTLKAFREKFRKMNPDELLE